MPLRITRLYAPVHDGITEARRSSHDVPSAAANIKANTSLSDELCRPAPRSKSFTRSWSAFTTLPLCATPSGPWMVSTTYGCTLRSLLDPVVE
ncbi:MAG: hypothetical protein R2770_04405 [Acidimicrobiales bacterium]